MEINLESLKEDEKKIIEYINSNEKDDFEDIIKENLLVEAVEKAIGKELLVSEEIVSDLEL